MITDYWNSLLESIALKHTERLRGDPIKHLWWSLLAKIVNDWEPFVQFCRNILSKWQLRILFEQPFQLHILSGKLYYHLHFHVISCTNWHSSHIRVITLIVKFVYKYWIAEAATRGILCKKVFLEIWQNSQENTCARVSFQP